MDTPSIRALTIAQMAATIYAGARDGNGQPYYSTNGAVSPAAEIMEHAEKIEHKTKLSGAMYAIVKLCDGAGKPTVPMLMGEQLALASALEQIRAIASKL